MISKETMLADLNAPQVEAVTHIDGPLLVLAGAGSGKTRVITRRIGYLISQGIGPNTITAITFTNKAADEMVRRVRDMLGSENGSGPFVSTFHSFCTLMLRMYGKHIGLDSNFTIFDMNDSGKVVRTACGDVGALPPGLTPAKAGEVISRAKTMMVKPEELSSRLDLPQYQTAALSRIYARYEALLAENKALDFDDLLLRTLALLDHPEARESVQRRCQYLLIDEYQDTNHVQYLLAKRFSDHTRNLCATGDPDQSIYGWRGAQISNILDFEKDFPDAHVVYLENNYRSTPQILQGADSVIRHNRQRKEKRLLPVVASGGKIRIHPCEDETQEAGTVADLIKESQKKGRKLSEVAVMCRVNSLFRTVEQTLRDRGIPYQLARGVSFFQRREIRDVMGYLRVIANPDDQVALERIINSPTRGIGAQAQSILGEYAERNGIPLYQALGQAGNLPNLGKSQASVMRFFDMMDRFRKLVGQSGGLEGLVQTVIDESTLRTHYRAVGEKEHRTDELSPEANLDEFLATAQKFDEETPEGTLTDFLSQQSLVSDVDGLDPESDRAILLTMHAAKGLEFEQVIIVGCEEEIIPHVFSMGSDHQIEEERRLMFVAMTRAKRDLHLTYAMHRATRGSYRSSAPSRFLKEIDPQVVEGLDVSEWTKPARANQFVISPRKAAPAAVSAPAAESASRPRCPYRTGQRVYHERFGYGVIQEIYLNGSNYMGSVNFHTSGVKKLVLNMAPLQMVRE